MGIATTTVPARSDSRLRAIGRWLRPSGDLVVGLSAFVLYLMVAHFAQDRVGAATANGHALARAERTLHLPAELSWNHWMAQYHVLTVVANYDYAIGYLLPTFGALFWVRATRRDAYPRVLASFLLLNLAAFAVFAAWPSSPPRLLGDAGFVDTVTRHHTVASWGDGIISSAADKYAAMPSLHVAWAVWAAVVLVRLCPLRWVARVGEAHVVFTIAVTILTGNHWWLDAAAGLVLALLAELVVAQIPPRTLASGPWLGARSPVRAPLGTRDRAASVAACYARDGTQSCAGRAAGTAAPSRK
ncbi:MAG TPA: phosphatase PAP2 family protein [Mycobacteriales bacterium]|jgi:hypothetical protein|nr:phosphatase PAP2 family protein [Mycobacteriales bacterium]